MNNVEIRVQSIQFLEGDKAQLSFNSMDSDRQINVSGYVTVTIEEYEANSQMDQLREIVRQKAVERLSMTGGNNE